MAQIIATMIQEGHLNTLLQPVSFCMGVGFVPEKIHIFTVSDPDGKEAVTSSDTIWDNATAHMKRAGIDPPDELVQAKTKVTISKFDVAVPPPACELRIWFGHGAGNGPYFINKTTGNTIPQADICIYQMCYGWATHHVFTSGKAVPKGKTADLKENMLKTASHTGKWIVFDNRLTHSFRLVRGVDEHNRIVMAARELIPKTKDDPPGREKQFSATAYTEIQGGILLRSVAQALLQQCDLSEKYKAHEYALINSASHGSGQYTPVIMTNGPIPNALKVVNKDLLQLFADKDCIASDEWMLDNQTKSAIFAAVMSEVQKNAVDDTEDNDNEHWLQYLKSVTGMVLSEEIEEKARCWSKFGRVLCCAIDDTVLE